MLILTGRILYALIFLVSGVGHFSNESISYAESHGLIMPSVLVPAAGILSMVSACSIIIGYKAKWGAWGIVAFLVPVTLVMHDFWNISDQMERSTQMIMFMKNISMLGGAFIIAHFGAGPFSVDRTMAN